jgi:hypothetical protein
MTLLSLARRLTVRAVVVVAVFGGSSVEAADETPPPTALAAPALAGAGCPTCAGGNPSPSCGRLGCGTPLFGKKKAPYAVQLCPGACFGYFQTQWHKWEDVCPLPYQGVGQSDAPRPSPGYVPTPGTLPDVKGTDTKPPKKPEGKGSDAPLPRPSTSPMPIIPNVPPPSNIGKPN